MIQACGAGGPELACGAINILWPLRWSPLMQKATLGSKPDFPITTSINLVTLARESEDKGVGFASGLIATLTVCRSYWKLPRECMRNDGSKSLIVMLGSVELWSQHMFPYVLSLLEDYTPSTHFLSTQAGAEGHRSVNERDKLNSPKMVEAGPGATGPGLWLLLV